MKLAFAGTPAFAAAALAALGEAGHELVLVLTQPDRPAGRGMKLQPSPVKQLALARAWPLLQPRSLKLDGRHPQDAAQAAEALRQAQPELIVVAAYGLMLPAWTLAVAPRGCLNIHASLLPRWRGAAPIHRAIEAGDPETGITLMQMDAGLDTGPICLAEAMPILADDSTGSLQDRLAALGARLTVRALARLEAGEVLTCRAQPEQGVCYASKVDKDQARLDWRWPAALIERRARAFDPAPGLNFELGGETVKLWRAAVVDGGGPPGTVLDAGSGRLVVACGDGALELRTLQRPGGRRQPCVDVLPRLAIAPGQRLTLPD